MSINERISRPNYTGDSPPHLDFGEIGTIHPVLKDVDQETGEIHRRVQPVYVGELDGTSSGDGTEHRDMCGNSKFEKVGDDRWRVTLQGVVTKSQMHELKRMKPADREIKIVSDVHTGFVEFDRFSITQTDDLNYGTFTMNGEEITEPLFKFQLQTRDNEE